MKGCKVTQQTAADELTADELRVCEAMRVDPAAYAAQKAKAAPLAPGQAGQAQAAMLRAMAQAVGVDDKTRQRLRDLADLADLGGQPINDLAGAQ